MAAEVDRRRKTLVFHAVAVVLAAAIIFGGMPTWLCYHASAMPDQASAKRDEHLLSQSRRLADFSRQATDSGDATLGLLLALEALPDTTSKNSLIARRPYCSSAELALERARRAFRELAVLKGHEGEITSVAVTADGSRIVTSSRDGKVRLWDTTTGKQLAVFEDHESVVNDVAVTADGSRIVTGSWNETVRVWDAATGKELAVFKRHERSLSSVAVTPDGSRIITSFGSVFGSYDNPEDYTARVWDGTTGKELAVLKGHEGEITSVAVTADGARVVTASKDSTARIWDAATGKQLAVLKGHESGLTSVAVTADGARIVTGSWDDTARLWDAATGKQLMVFEGNVQMLTSVAVTADGSRVVTGSWDETARLWDAATGKELAVLRGHSGVSSVAVTADGSRIITGSDDKTARIWDAATGKKLAVLKGQALVDEVKSIVPRCLSPAQRQHYRLPPKPPVWCRSMKKWPYQAEQ